MNLTASGLHAAELCPARTHLPQFPRSHADADAGTLAHAIKELEAAPGEQTEVVFSLNTITGEAATHPRNGHRGYPSVPGDARIFGTADAIRVEPDHVVVIDHKTGFGYNVEPARSNLQLGFYAVAAARVYGKDAARVEIRHASGYVDAYDMDAITLDALEYRIKQIHVAARLSESLPARVRPGELQCWRCPCFARCPAQLQLALTLSSGVDARELPTLELTPEAVAKGWVKLKQIKAVLNEIERAYRGYASEQLVQLSGGKFLGRREKSTESVDGRVAFEVLSETYGEAVAKGACEMETSKAALTRALKDAVAKGKGAEALRDVLAAIKIKNGITTKTGYSVEEY